MDKNYYGRTSNPNKYYSREDTILFNQYVREHLKEEILENRKDTIGGLLLDSSLISQTLMKNYDIKLVSCGDYTYVYRYMNKQAKVDTTITKMKDKKVNVLKIIINSTNKKKKLIKENKYFNDKKELTVEIRKKEKVKKENKLKEIDEKNINRSKVELQKIIKTNEKKFKTFITLTFEDSINDIESANKKFNIFRTKIKRIKKDFIYICVPEFTKQGRVHYHMLTNIDYDDIKLINENIIYSNLLRKFQKERFVLSPSSSQDREQSFFFSEDEVQPKKGKITKNTKPTFNSGSILKISTWNEEFSLDFKKSSFAGNIKNKEDERKPSSQKKENPFSKVNYFPICLRVQRNRLHNTKKTFNYKSRSNKVFKTLKYWNEGFSNIIPLDDINIVAYLTKYLTKDIDNRLFGKRRYFYSQNLEKPSTVYLDLNNVLDFISYANMIKENEEKYWNLYFDRFEQPIFFIEYKLKENFQE